MVSCTIVSGSETKKKIIGYIIKYGNKLALSELKRAMIVDKWIAMHGTSTDHVAM